MKKSARVFNTSILIFGILCLIYYAAMGLAVRFGQSLMFLWLLLGLACIARYILWKRAWKKGKAHPFPRWLIVTVRCLIIIALLFFFLVESIFILPAAFQKPAQGMDAIVVLGARVNADGPSGSLHERICTARDYLELNPDTICIASGGQGSDEPMSEAACIAENLVAEGIAPERILTEGSSTSTVENLTFSFAMLPEGCKSVGIVTNDFHIYRAVAVGQSFSGLELHGIPAPSTVSGFVHYAMREFFALTVSWLTGELTFS